MDDLLTVEEAAAELGLKPRRVQVLVREGRLPVYRVIGQAQTFRRADVDAFKAVPRPRGRPRKSAPDGSAAPPEGEQPS